MSSSLSPVPLLSKYLLFSLLSFLFLLLFSFSSPISAASSNTSTSHKPLLFSHPYQKCIHEHHSALLQLKRGFNFSYSHGFNFSYSHGFNFSYSHGFNFSYSHANLSSWNLTNTDCCSWEGIACNSSTGHVIGLNLSRLFISGPINFKSLLHLRSLQRLDLSWNDFDPSPIPFGFGQLSNLTHLSLSSCLFYGRIPLDIFHLTRLVSLDLSNNYAWHGPLKLASSGMGQLFRNLSSLRELFLDRVDMSAMAGQWSRMLSDAFPNLRKLSMRECGLSGPIHPSISRLHSLTLLDLSSNHLASPVPESISNLTSLTNLNLRNCDLHHQFPNTIFNLPKLQSLDISGNQFLIIYLPKFSTNSTIQNLMMSGIEFQGSLVDFLGNFKHLTHLDLSNSNVLGVIPQSHVNLSQLVSLDLSFNNFQGPIPTFISDLTQLNTLRLSSNNLSGVLDICSFQSLKKLESLDLSYNGFSAIINSRNCSASTSFPQPCVNLSQLVSLDLSDNNIQGPIPTFISDLTQLNTLWLSSNNLSGVLDICSFQSLKKLESLDLSYNGFSAIINSRNCSASTSFPQPCVNLSQLVSLDLSDNNIQGPIPTFISDLTQLNTLRLSSNNLSGVLDICSFQSLKKLESLDLSYNGFSAITNSRNCSASASIPESCVSLSQLEELYLSNNNFQGPIPMFISELTGLRSLLLSSNNFSGVMDLGLFQNLKNLEDLSLDNNSFRGPIPRLTSELTELGYLGLSSNNFSGVIDLGMFQNLKNLEELSLSDNSLTDIIYLKNNSISTSLPQLRFLYLSSCKIRKFPDVLRNQEKMVYLDLSSNKISGKIPQWMWKVGGGNLNYLNLSNNALEGLEGSFPHLSLSSVRSLDLSNNMLKGSTPIPPPSSLFFSLANNELDGQVYPEICDAQFLRVLDLSNNHFTGVLPQCLDEISNALVVLNLHRNAFGGPLPQTFKQGCTLEMLDLSDNQLEGQIPKSLANCQQLTVLNLGNNQIQDQFPSHLANSQNLRVLVLRSNKFQGSVGQPLTSQAFFPCLQIIDLSFNNFSGSLPSNVFSAWKMMKDDGSASEFLEQEIPLNRSYQDKVLLVSKGIEMEFVKILVAFTVVDLSHNGFHGDIPSSVGELKALHVLNLSHNHFQGQIPASFENLRELESLDLSNNGLYGKIPWQLTTLSFLAVLNLSQNQLTGSIPQGRHFDTFGNESFLGNPGLCGVPLSRKCEVDAVWIPPRESNSKRELDFMWMGFGVGYGVGIGIFCWTLALWRKGRRAFFMFVDRVVYYRFSFLL